MDIWSVLGIERTDDEEAIREAYLEQLAHHHPEEDPDGFMMLRKAFEEAMRQKEEPEAADINPAIRSWMDRAEELYGDFRRRICPEEWKKLLKDPVCISLETAEEANHALLAFLMDHVYIPHAVWKTLAEYLGWFENRLSLCQSFPENYIDYVLNQAAYPDSFRYDGFQFEPGKDYDLFIKSYFELSRMIREEEEEAAAALLRQMLDMNIEHPDFRVLQVRYYLSIRRDAGAAWSLAQKIKRAPGERAEERELFWYVEAGIAVGKGAEVKPSLERLLLLDGDHPSVMRLAGDYYAAMEECQTALLYYDRAAELDEDGDYDEPRDKMNEILSYRMEEELKLKPSENLKRRTGRACYYGRRYGRAREILESLDNPEEGDEELYGWLADACFKLEDYQTAEDYCDRILEKSPLSQNAFSLKVRLLSARRADAELIRLVEPALKKGYRSVQVIYNYACALRRQKEFEKAEEYLGMLEEQMGAHPTLMAEFARLYSDMERYEEALERLDAVLKEQPENAECLYLKTEVLFDLKCYEEALAIYRGQEERGRADEYDFYRMGNLCYRLRRYEDAEAYYKRSIGLNPGNQQVYNDLGDTYQKLGRMEEAVEAYKTALRGEEEWPVWIWDLSRLLKRMKRWEESLSYCLEGMKRYPEDDRFYYMAGLNAQSLKRYEEAIGYFEAYGELDDRQDALKHIAICCKKMAQMDRAEEYYFRAVRDYPESADAWQALGIYFMKDKEEYGRALEYLLKAEELEEDAAYRRICIGCCYEKLGDSEKSREYFLLSLQAAQKRIKKNPYSPCAYEAAAEAYSYLGDTEHTEEMAKKALEMHLEHFGCPQLNCYEAFQDMGRSWEARGELEKALNCYEEAWKYAELDEDKETIGRLKRALGRG